MKQVLITLIAFCLCTTACKEAAKEAPTEKPAVASSKYTLTAFTPSTAYPDAKISSMEYKDGKFNFGVDDGSYTLGLQTPDADAKMCANSGKGQHIHLIVDKAPYAAKYTNAFDYEIEDGDHHLLAFLSRSYHESIKTMDAHLAYKTSIKNNSIVKVEEIKDPMLWYSRPKGTYVGKKDTEKVMLDFYLSNITLGEYKVKADINGEMHTIEAWQPYYIEGLPMGDNTITLTLIDADDSVVDIPNNPVSRTFKLEADPAE